MPSAESSLQLTATTLVDPRVADDLGVVSWEDTTRQGSLTPFFQTEPNPDATRRLLLVFFYFPPSAEVGALRWLSLSRFGAERGWAIDVVSLHAEFMGTVDPTRLRQLPPGIRVFGFSGDLYGERATVSLFGFLRGEQKFDGLDTLVAQMRRDEAEAQALLAGVRPLSELDYKLAFKR